MTRVSVWFAVTTVLLSGSVRGQGGPEALKSYAVPEDPNRIPVKRVVLYKNGVGYFEHLGQVRDNQTVTITFTPGQLNDVLKSLTVLDLSGGRIAGVGYGSATPLERQIADLRLPSMEKGSLTEFLGALRGARLEVRSGTAVITGRLLSVERKTRISGGTTLEVDYVSLLTDAGELRTTELSPAFSVRMLERGLAGKVDRFLDLASAGREADVRRMEIATQGSGERSVFVSYISEVPVWKATYRVVLGSKKGQNPLLQGWAIVDNTVGQDWQNVQLSLVAGAPQSFIQNLAQPYYSRRPTVGLPQSLNISPQTFESTLTAGGARITGVVTDPAGASIAGVHVTAYDANSSVVGQAFTRPNGSYDLSALPEGSVRVEFELPGFKRTVADGVNTTAARATVRDVRLELGETTETVTVAAEPSSLQTESASIASGRNLGSGRGLGSAGGVGGGVYGLNRKMPSAATPPPPAMMAARARAESAAFAQELGDLFEYKLKEPITIRKDRSALVPIVQSQIAAEKVSVWNEQAGLPKPQRALWLTNSTGLTLDGGSFSVLEEETFAGEGVFDPIRPGEKRLVSYATDLAVNANSRNSSDAQRVTRVRVSRGVMTQESEIREKKTYTFRNEDSGPRTIIVEHPVRVGYNLRSEIQPIELTSGWMRFRVPVESKQTATLVVEEARPLAATYSISSITSDQLGVFVRQRSIDKSLEDALRRILAQQAVVRDLSGQQNAHENETEKIFDDQQRLRENIKALKGSPEEKALLQRYTQQLNSQESRLEAIKKETAQLKAQQEKAQAELERMIQDLSFDVAL